MDEKVSKQQSYDDRVAGIAQEHRKAIERRWDHLKMTESGSNPTKGGDDVL